MTEENQVDMFDEFRDENEFQRCVQELADWGEHEKKNVTHCSGHSFKWEATRWIDGNVKLAHDEKIALHGNLWTYLEEIKWIQNAEECGL